MKNIIKLFIVTLLFMLTILFSVTSNAQVGIGTTNPQAILDIQPNTTETTYATGDGILIPRVTAIPSPAGADDGELVYVNGVGFFFYDGPNTSWSSILDSDAALAIQQNFFSKVGPTFPTMAFDNWEMVTQGTGTFKEAFAGSFTLASDGSTQFNILISGGVPCSGCRNDAGVVDNDYTIFTDVRLQILDASNTVVHAFNPARGTMERNGNIAFSASSYQFLGELTSAVLPAGNYTFRLRYRAVGGRGGYALGAGSSSTIVFSPGRISGLVSFIND